MAKAARPSKDKPMPKKRVTFELAAPAAGAVSVAGSFCGWDPGAVALLLLPFVLFGLILEWRARNTPSSLVPDHTVVTVTTCPRHRRFARRFVWLVVLWAVILGGVWAVAVQWNKAAPNQSPLWLVGVVLFLALGVPLILYLVYVEHGPVRVTRVRRDTVTLGFVRPAYFTAPEPKP